MPSNQQIEVSDAAVEAAESSWRADAPRGMSAGPPIAVKFRRALQAAYAIDAPVLCAEERERLKAERLKAAEAVEGIPGLKQGQDACDVAYHGHGRSLADAFALGLAVAADSIRQQAAQQERERIEAALLGKADELERPNEPGEDFTAATVRKVKAQGIREALAALNPEDSNVPLPECDGSGMDECAHQLDAGDAD